MATQTTSTDQMKIMVSGASTAAVPLLNEIGLGEIATGIDDLVGQMNSGVFKLVVMGEIKKGKSSFINALLGAQDLLPVDTDIATSTVYKVIYGPERKFRVFFLPDPDSGFLPDPIEINENQIAEFGTETGNPRNVKGVDFIAVEFPSDLLKSGLCIVDTPGVGGLFKAHLATTWKYAPNADAVFFVLDSVEALLSSDEIEFLKKLTNEITSRVYFVQTKKDKASKAQWSEWERRNRAILLDNLPALTPESLRYFVVSSTLKHQGDSSELPQMVQDSGYLEVRNFLVDELIQEKDRYIAVETAKLLISKVNVAREQITMSLQSATTASQERMKELEAAVLGRRKDLVSWEQTEYQEIKQVLSDRFRDLRQSTNDRLNDLLDPSTPALMEFLDDLRKQQVTAADLDSQVATYQQQWIGLCSQKGNAVLVEFGEQLQQLVLDTLESFGDHLDKDQFLARIGQVRSDDWGAGVGRHDSMNLNLGFFSTARSTLAGGSLAAGVATVVGHLVFPGVGGLLAGGIVTLFAAAGAKMAYDSHASERKNQAINQLERFLRETISTVRKNALRDFGRISSDSEKAILQMFKTVLKATHDRYDLELKTLQEARLHTAEQRKLAADACRERLRRTDEITRLLDAVVSAS